MARITKKNFDNLLQDFNDLLKANEKLKKVNERLREEAADVKRLKKALDQRIAYGDGVEQVKRARQRNLRLLHAFTAAKQMLANAIHNEMTDLHNETQAERRNGS